MMIKPQITAMTMDQQTVLSEVPNKVVFTIPVSLPVKPPVKVVFTIPASLPVKPSVKVVFTNPVSLLVQCKGQY